MKRLSILLAEDSPLFRAALSSSLSKTGAAVVACGLIRARELECREFDVVLVDIATFSGPDESLSEWIQVLLKLGPVLLLARRDRIDQTIMCLKAGASGVLTQTASEKNLRAAVHAVANGFAWCDGHIFRDLARHLLPVSQWQEPKLTRREEEVLQCITQGQANKEIALKLALSEQSVKVYVSNLLRKLGVPNRGLLALRVMARRTEAA